MQQNQQLQRRQPEPELVRLVKKMGPQMDKAVPSHLTGDRMARITLTALRVTPKLADCTKSSFLGAVMSAATLGLEVNTPLGHAYLIPFHSRKRGVTECQLIIGYRGMMEIARRSGVVRSIRAVVVRKCDRFEVTEGLNANLIHVPNTDQDSGHSPITHVYAVARLADGDPIFVWLTKAEVERRRGRSLSKRGSPWDTDYEAMAKKTAVRALFPWLPQSTEVARLATAVALDEAADRGASQVRAYSPEVVEALDAVGVELEAPSDEDAEGEPPTEDPADALGDFCDELEEREEVDPRG